MLAGELTVDKPQDARGTGLLLPARAVEAGEVSSCTRSCVQVCSHSLRADRTVPPRLLLSHVRRHLVVCCIFS